MAHKQLRIAWPTRMVANNKNSISYFRGPQHAGHTRALSRELSPDHDHHSSYNATEAAEEL